MTEVQALTLARFSESASPIQFWRQTCRAGLQTLEVAWVPGSSQKGSLIQGTPQIAMRCGVAEDFL
jgi:hypothetical protein